MSDRKPPLTAEIIVPVDGITAARASADGLKVDYPPRKVNAVLTLPLDPTHPAVIAIADHVTPVIHSASIALDLSDGLRTIRDESPPIVAEVPGVSRSPLWPEPCVIRSYSGAVHLPAGKTTADLPDAILNWLSEGSAINESRLSSLQDAWQRQGDRMLQHATAVVESCRATVPDVEWQSLLRKLEQLAGYVRHPRDGGPFYDEPDYEQDDFGDRFLKPSHWYINETYDAVLTACERYADAGTERSRGEHAQAELKQIVAGRKDAVPERFSKAQNLGLLASLMGAARTELLPIAWPGWRYLEDHEHLKPIVNPSDEAVDELVSEIDADSRLRRWEHDPVSLRWLTPGKKPALVSSFLGRAIIRDLTSTAASR